MKLISRVITFCIVLLLSATIFAADTTPQTNAAKANQPNQKQESGLLAWLIVLNNNEIQAAKEILKRKDLDPQVKEFAQLMISQHTQLLNETKDVGKKLHVTPANNDNARTLASAGNKELAELKELDDHNVQKPYINAMVTGHENAKTALTDYIKNEANPDIKKLLEETNHHVEMHLEKAQKVQKDISA